MPTQKPSDGSQRSAGEASHAMLRQALETTRQHVLAAADAAKANVDEGSPEVTRIRRVVRGEEDADLGETADKHRAHAKTIEATAAAHKTAIDDLIEDLAEIFDAE